MKTISIYNPWAFWISIGLKLIETRKHDRFKNLAGNRIAIHAGQKFDRLSLSVAHKYIPPEYGLTSGIPPKGVILCTAMVKEARWLTDKDSKAALCDCSRGNLFGLILEDIIKLDPPIRCKGHQGIFNVEIEPEENKPYRPSNGSEGQGFTERWCDQCIRRALDPCAKTQCIHECRALAGDEHNGKWFYIDGVPTCTAFRSKKDRKRKRYKKKDPNQDNLFKRREK